MEELKEVKPKKKRPRPEGASPRVSDKEVVGERPKKKRPRPEGASPRVSDKDAMGERPKKKRPRPESARVEVSADVRPKKKKRPVEQPVKEKKVVNPEAKKKAANPKRKAEVEKAAVVNATEGRENVKRRGKRKKKKGGIVSTFILIIALGVFAFSVFNLAKIFKGYQAGKSEYDEVISLAIEGNEEEESFKVNFEELLKINKDTVGWIRFFPEPAQINYPVVQGPDNDLYLSKTFSANDNTVGAIFVNVYNNPDFNDKHTIVYGHRMNDNSMFHDLAKYADRKFWESNPYFYIYTPDGRKIAYKIYAAGEILETSDTYNTKFENDEAFQAFLDLTEQEAAYATGVNVDINDEIVTLSTCVKGKDEARFVVRGVKDLEVTIE